MQGRGLVLAGSVVALVVIAFAAGIGATRLMVPASTFSTTDTITETLAGQAQTTTITRTVASNGTLSTLTEEVIQQPVNENDICVQFYSTSTTTTYLFPANETSPESPFVITTTTTLLSQTTVYENVTMISNGGYPCLEINPHYNMTGGGCPPCI